MKRILKTAGVVLGITAIAVAVKSLLTAIDNILYEEEWDEDDEDEADAEETLSVCEEAYDRGYLHGLHGLPYAGKNSVALAFQDVATAETMAMYHEIVQENLQADVAEPYVAE